MRRYLLLLLLIGVGFHPRCFAQASPYNLQVFKAQSFTATGQTGTVIQLNGLVVPSTIGSSFSSGAITVTGVGLTTVSFQIMGSADNGATYYPLNVNSIATPTTLATTTTITANGLYQVNLAGLTHVKFVTTGTFTATSVSITLTASPNALTSRSGGGAAFPSTPSFVFATSASASRAAVTGDMATFLAGLSGCSTLGFVYSPASSTCVSPTGSGASLSAANTWTATNGFNGAVTLGTSFPSLFTPAPSDTSGMINLLPLNTNGSSTAVNPGIALESNSSFGTWGLTLGFFNSRFSTMRIAPTSGTIADCFHTSGAFATTMAQLVANCPLIISSTSFTVSQPITAASTIGFSAAYPQFFVPAPTSASGMINLQPLNTNCSTTAVSPGINVMTNSSFGAWGYTCTFFNSRFWTTLYAPSAAAGGGVAFCLTAQGSLPTTMALLTANCPFQLNETGFNFSAVTSHTADVTIQPGADLTTPTIGVSHGGFGFLNFPGIINYGDSITAGFVSQGNNTGYAFMMDPEFLGASLNKGVSGDQACDTARKDVYQTSNPTATGNPTVSLMIGTNDANLKGSSAPYAAVYQECLYGSLAWLGIPSSSKVLGQSGSVTATGTWTADNTIVTGVGLQSSTNGNSISFPITTLTGPIYIGYRIFDGNTGSATVQIDGAAVGTLFSSGGASGGVTIATQNGSTDSVAAARFPVAAGAHTVVITLAGTTGQQFTFMWAGTPAKPQSPGPPRILVGGIIRQFGGSDDAFTSAFDGYVRTITTQLWTDGIYAAYVPTRSYLNIATDMAPTNVLHPIDIGHQHLRDAFLNGAGLMGGFATLKASITTLAVASETVSIPGVSSTSGCSLSSGNSAAATNYGTAFLGAPTAGTPPPAGSILLTHASVAGMIYNVSCTP